MHTKIVQGGLYLDEADAPTLLVKVISKWCNGRKAEVEVISGTDGWCDGHRYEAEVSHLREPTPLEMLAWTTA